MKTTKNTFVSKHVDALSAASAAGIGKADPVPSKGAPKAPEDFVPSKTTRGSRLQPAPALIKAAPAAAKELLGSATYAEDFGASAPDAEAVATNIAFAAAWSAECTNAESWCAYVKEQTRLAWSQANPQLDELGPVFAYARDRDDGIGTKYASTAKLFDVRKEPAVKGAAVRASKKAAAKGARKAQDPATTPPATDEGANAAGAAPPSAPTTVAAPKP